MWGLGFWARLFDSTPFSARGPGRGRDPEGELWVMLLLSFLF